MINRISKDGNAVAFQLLEKDHEENFNISAIMKDNIMEDKNETSSIPILKSKDKIKPKYSQVKSLKGINSKQKPIEEQSTDAMTCKKRKKRVCFRNKLIDFVDVESYKASNKRNTWPDGMPDDGSEEGACKDCKECVEKMCIVF